MTEKGKERFINWGISFVTALSAVILGFSMSSSEGKSIRIEEELEERPKFDYVDKQDAAVQKNLDDYKHDHQYQHSTEMQSVDKRLDAMMDYWKIPYEGRGD